MCYKKLRKKNGQCLDPYLGTKHRHRFVCIHGHLWSALGSSIVAGTWCPTCARIQRQQKTGSPNKACARYTIDDLVSWAQAKQGQCLTTSYPGPHTKVAWACAKGHTWQAFAKSVRHGSWCPTCKGQNSSQRLRRPYARIVELCQQSGYKLITSQADYDRAHHTVEVRCSNGHQQRKAPGKIQIGQGCAACMGSRGETIARLILEHLFDAPWPKIRPDWIKGSYGRPLELDGFCEKHQIAFEYQGRHHGPDSPWPTSLPGILARDAQKQGVCERMGIRLIAIPLFAQKDWASSQALYAHILKALADHGVQVALPAVLNDVVFQSQNRNDLANMHAWGQQYGLICQALVFRGPRQLEQWTCTLCQKTVSSSWGALKRSAMTERGLGCSVCCNKRTRQATGSSYGLGASLVLKGLRYMVAQQQQFRSRKALYTKLCHHIPNMPSYESVCRILANDPLLQALLPRLGLAETPC